MRGEGGSVQFIRVTPLLREAKLRKSVLKPRVSLRSAGLVRFSSIYRKSIDFCFDSIDAFSREKRGSVNTESGSNLFFSNSYFLN
jgi:hypothetical protein